MQIQAVLNNQNRWLDDSQLLGIQKPLMSLVHSEVCLDGTGLGWRLDCLKAHSGVPTKILRMMSWTSPRFKIRVISSWSFEQVNVQISMPAWSKDFIYLWMMSIILWIVLQSKFASLESGAQPTKTFNDIGTDNYLELYSRGFVNWVFKMRCFYWEKFM